MNDSYKARFVPGIRAVFVCLMLGFLGIGTAHAFGFACVEGKAPLPHAKKKTCVPCGHAGQPACEALRKGPECGAYLQKINGICEARGGQGQKQYKKGLGFIGFDCKPGYQKDPNRKGYCTACGELNQPSCEAARKGPACAKGLKPKTMGIWGKCVPDNSVERELKKRATAEIQKHLQDIVDIVIRARNEGANQASVRSAVTSYREVAKPGAKTVTAVDIQPLVLHGTMGTRSLSSSSSGGGGGGFSSWTLGAGGDANVGVGVSVETGLALPFAGQGRKGYTQVSTDFQIGFGGSAGVTVGLSTSAYDKQGGKALGYKVSVGSVVEMVKNLKDLAQIVDNFKKLGAVQPDLAIGVWFNRAAGGGVGSFQGITATIGGAAGPNVGATYSQGQTFQF